jgi:6-phosphogluconolactonase
MRWNLILLFLVSFVSCFCQDPYLFIGTYTNGASKGIYVYRFNTVTGVGTEVSTTPAKNPSYLSISSDGKHVYATDENETSGAVGAYAFEPSTGKLAFLNSQSTGGTCPCYVSEDKSSKWVFVANYCSGSLAALPVNSDGSLAPVMQIIQQLGKGPNTVSQEAGHVHSTIFSPDEKFLLTANLGTDQEHVYAFNPNQNIPLTDRYDSVISLTPGTGPRHITFLPAKNDVYIVGELTGTVDAFHFDDQTGKLTHFQRIKTTAESFKGDPGSADIHISPNGKFLYATNRGTANSIATFSIQEDGSLVNKQIISVNGNHPRNFVIDQT